MARVLLFCLASFIGVANCHPDGAPTSACKTMTPQHHGDNLFSGPEYDIAAACYVFFPSESMSVRIWDRNGADKFKGLFMQLYDGQDNLSGTWNVPTTTKGLKTTSCGGSAHNGVTHANKDLKRDNETSVIWTAPLTCAQNEEFTIKATVVKSYSHWDKAEVSIVCNPDYSNAEVMERFRPPLKSQYCAQGSWAIIPKGASTSFEIMSKRGGWRHFYGATGLRFARLKSPKAGEPNPNNYPQAVDGDYYLYYKSKGTKKHDMAGLLSPFGIQGCFCLSFECHMATDGKTKFTLSTIGDIQSLVLETVAVTPQWRPVSFSFLTNRPVVFAFQVFNSGVQSGGVGLDKIVVKAGPCDSDATGYSGFINLTDDDFP